MLFKRRPARFESENARNSEAETSGNPETSAAPSPEASGRETRHRSLGSLIHDGDAARPAEDNRYRAMLAAMEREGGARMAEADGSSASSEICYTVEAGGRGAETPVVEIFFSKCEANEDGVRFEVQAPEARSVELALDCFDWKPEPMVAEGGGGRRWRLTKALPRGEHRYKFVVEGQWMNDPLNPLKKPNPFGGVDSIVRVSFGP